MKKQTVKQTVKNLTKLAKMAREHFLECYESGHYPDWICDGISDEEDLKYWAKEYDMTVAEFKQYSEFFENLCNS